MLGRGKCLVAHRILSSYFTIFFLWRHLFVREPGKGSSIYVSKSNTPGSLATVLGVCLPQCFMR
jgi:hypothetical protein